MQIAWSTAYFGDYCAIDSSRASAPDSPAAMQQAHVASRPSTRQPLAVAAAIVVLRLPVPRIANPREQTPQLINCASTVTFTDGPPY